MSQMIVDYTLDSVSPSNPDASIPASLDLDEFIADMWSKGIRFGIDVAAVRAAIASGKSERVIVAQRLRRSMKGWKLSFWPIESDRPSRQRMPCVAAGSSASATSRDFPRPASPTRLTIPPRPAATRAMAALI